MRFMPDFQGLLERIEDLMPQRVLNLWRWTIYSGASLSRAIWLMDISVVMTLLFGVYLAYIQLFTPMRVPNIYMSAYIPGLLGLCVMRGRMEVATSMLRTKKLSSLTWRMLSRTGGGVTILLVGLMDFMCGYNSTHLAYIISSTITYMTAYSCLFFLIVPTTRTADEAYDRATRAPSMRLMPGLIKAWGRLVWEYV